MGDEVLQGILDVVLFRWEIFSSDGWSEGKPDLGWQMAVEEQAVVSFKCSIGVVVLRNMGVSGYSICSGQCISDESPTKVLMSGGRDLLF
jgi:hypothetical protein